MRKIVFLLLLLSACSATNILLEKNGDDIVLDLSNKGLRNLSKFDLTNYSNVNKINLNGNNFSEFPMVLINLPNLETILLNGNKLKSIPEDIVRLKNLRVLSLNNNDIYQIPNLKELEKLEIISMISSLSNTEVDKIECNLPVGTVFKYQYELSSSGKDCN